MPPLHRDTSELGVVRYGKEIWTRPHGTTRGEKRHTGTPRVSQCLHQNQMPCEIRVKSKQSDQFLGVS